MNKQDFSSCKVGDKLWSIQLGECEVIELIDKEIIVKGYNDKNLNYYWDGNYYEDDLMPSLFWSNPQIQIPEKPKRKVKKEEKIIIIEHEWGRQLYYSMPEIINEKCKIHEAVLTYEVEE